MLEHEREVRKDLHLVPDAFVRIRLEPISESTITCNVLTSHISQGNMEAELSLHDAIEVQLEILTNWGHPLRVGLTEVQAMTEDKMVLPILPSNIGVSGCDNEKGDLANLVNGKTKVYSFVDLYCVG